MEWETETEKAEVNLHREEVRVGIEYSLSGSRDEIAGKWKICLLLSRYFQAFEKNGNRCFHYCPAFDLDTHFARF